MRKSKRPAAKLHPAAIISLIIFAVMVIGSYIRLYVSVGLLGAQDEMHWVGSAFSSSIGGTPFVNDLYIQQLCGLVYEPLVFAYHWVFGETGVLLFVRHLYFFLTLFGAAISFRFFRSRTDLGTALAISSVPIVGSMWGQPSLGYNAIGGVCFGAGSLLALEGVDQRSIKKVIASGVLFFFALAAYPTLLGALFVLWVLILAARIYARKPFLKDAIVANSVTAGLLVLFIGILALRSSFESLQFAYTFSTAQSSMGSFLGKLQYGLWLMFGFLPPWYFVLPGFVTWLILNRLYKIPWQVFAVPLTLIVAFSEPPEPGPFYPPLLVVLGLSGLPIIFSALKKDFAQHWIEGVFFAAAMISMLFPWWSSALTVYVVFVTGNYCLGPLFALSSRGRSPWLALLTFVIPVTIFFHKVALRQFDDGGNFSSAVMLTEGPYAGLLTSPERAQFFSRLSADVKNSSNKAKSILFYDEFPLGYLMTDLYPATPALFMHGLRESYAVKPFFRAYYSNPAKRPDLIVRFKYFDVGGNRISVHPEQYKPYEDVFWNYLPLETGEYEMVQDRDSYSIFRKISLR